MVEWFLYDTFDGFALVLNRIVDYNWIRFFVETVTKIGFEFLLIIIFSYCKHMLNERLHE